MKIMSLFILLMSFKAIIYCYELLFFWESQDLNDLYRRFGYYTLLLNW